MLRCMAGALIQDGDHPWALQLPWYQEYVNIDARCVMHVDGSGPECFGC